MSDVATPARSAWGGSRIVPAAIAVGASGLVATIALLGVGAFKPPGQTSPANTAQPATSATAGGGPAATRTAPTEFAAARVTVDGLRVRSAPGLDEPIVGTLLAGEVVAIVGEPVDADDHEWVEIGRGLLGGWIAQRNPDGEEWLARASEVAPLLVVQLEVVGHVIPLVPLPDVTALADGQYISVETSGTEQPSTRVVVRQLSSDGLRQLRAELLGTDLFEASVTYTPERTSATNAPGHGGSGVRFTTVGSEGPIAVSAETSTLDQPEFWTNAPQAYQLRDISKLLLEPMNWLPAEAWVDSSGSPYRAPHFLALSDIEPDTAFPESLPPVDVDDVDWPFDGPPELFGESVDLVGDAVWTNRCQIVDAEMAVAIVDSVRSAGLGIDPDLSQTSVAFELRWSREDGRFGMQLVPVLPTVDASCSAILVLE